MQVALLSFNDAVACDTMVCMPGNKPSNGFQFIQPGSDVSAYSPRPVAAIVFDMYGVLYDGAKFNDVLLNVIRTLKPAYKIGLLSNIGKSRLDELLNNQAMDGLFDATLASSEVMFSKPHPELFQTIAERLDVSLGEMLFIDDSEDNIAGATFLGIQAHLYRENTALTAWLVSQGVAVTGLRTD